MSAYFMFSSGILRETFLKPSQVPEELPKKPQRIYIVNPNRIRRDPNQGVKKYFAEALHTLCNLSFSQQHICITGAEPEKVI